MLALITKLSSQSTSLVPRLCMRLLEHIIVYLMCTLIPFSFKWFGTCKWSLLTIRLLHFLIMVLTARIMMTILQYNHYRKVYDDFHNLLNI